MRYLIICVLTFMLVLPVEAHDFENGWAAYRRGDYATAQREFRLLAKQGDAAAQFNLGLMYDKGQGVPQDGGVRAK